MVTMVVFFMRERFLLLGKSANACMVALLCVLLALPFAFVNSNALRAAWYYMMLLILFVPMFFEAIEPRLRHLFWILLFLGAFACLFFTAPLVLPDTGYKFIFLPVWFS